MRLSLCVVNIPAHYKYSYAAITAQFINDRIKEICQKEIQQFLLTVVLVE